MVSTLELIRRLHDAQVEFVIIGGIAAAAYGSKLITEDLDVCAPMYLENLQRVIRCLQDANPKFRMRPDLPVITPENRNLIGIKNLYLTSDVGFLDILGDVPGIGDYATCLQDATVMEMAGRPCNFLQIDKLIKAKRTAGRPRDHLAIAQIEAIHKRLVSGQPPPMPPNRTSPDAK